MKYFIRDKPVFDRFKNFESLKRIIISIRKYTDT